MSVAAQTVSRGLRVAERQERTAVLGMVLFIASWAMLFAGLFFAYALIRLRTPAWPPTDLPVAPKLLPSLATAVLFLSSWVLERGLHNARARRPAGAAIAAAALLGTAFLAVQSVVWRGLYLGGLVPSSGTYASVFYGLTVFHALHVGIGVLALAGLALRAAMRPALDLVIPVRLWTLYWHMVGVIWAVMFLLVYLF